MENLIVQSVDNVLVEGVIYGEDRRLLQCGASAY